MRGNMRLELSQFAMYVAMSEGTPIRCHASEIPLSRPGESNALALSKARISMFSALSEESSRALMSCRMASSVPEFGIPPTWYGHSSASSCK